jgi:DNA polymerase-3 subunit delta'
MADELKRIRALPWFGETWREWRAARRWGHHAVLLHGPAGIGTTGLAFDLAAGLLCESPRDDGTPCGRCPGCVLADTRNHPDLRVVVPDTLAWLRPAAEEDAESDDSGVGEEDRRTRISREIRIDTVRAVNLMLELTAHRAGMRVVLLAPAEALNASAANALLKMLEEPPPRAQFILTSERVEEVLPTIRSRCTLVRVGLPAQAVALGWLQEQGVVDAQAALAAAGGAPLKALEGSDPAAALPEATAAMLLQALAAGAALDVVETGARLPRTVGVPEAIDLFQRWAWDLLAVRQIGRVRYHPQRRDKLARLASGTTTERLLAWCDALARARAAAEHPLNARLVIESLLAEYVQRVRADGMTGTARTAG